MSANIAFCARDLDRAARCAREALLVEPNFWVAHYQLGRAYQQMARNDQALPELAEASRLSNGNSKPLSVSACALAESGRADDARAVVFALEQQTLVRYVPPYAIALGYSGLNEDARVFEWLERALAVRDVHLIYLPLDPKWDRFRQDQRFADFVDRCGFGSGNQSRHQAIV
jgi:hypothetical protein